MPVLVEQQLVMLHLREGQYAVGQVEQVQSFFLQQFEVLALVFGLSVQATATQIPRRHQNGADRRLHVVHHGVGEVLAHLRQLVLTTDGVYLFGNAISQQQEAHHRTQQIIELCPDGLGTKVKKLRTHPVQTVYRDDERTPVLQLPFVIDKVMQGRAKHHGRVARQRHRVQSETEATQSVFTQLLMEEGVQSGLGAKGVTVVGAAPGFVNSAHHTLAVESQAHTRPAAEKEDGYGSGNKGEEDVEGLGHLF